MLKVAHSKSTHICAFCAHWFDPSCSAIKPKAGDFWLYETTARKRCTKKRLDTQSWVHCNDFQGKL